MSALSGELRPGCVEDCPGCRHRMLSAEESAAQKTRWLSKALSRWGESIEEIRVPSEKEGERWGYRRKTCLGAEWEKGRWKIGLRRRRPGADARSSDTCVVEIPDCPVHSKEVRKVIQALSRELPGPETLSLAYVAVSGSILSLVLKTDERSVDVPSLAARFSDPRSPLFGAGLGLTGVFLNFHPSTGDRVFSSRGWRLVWGEARARDSRGWIHGPDSFQQLISDLHQSALEEALRFLSPTRTSAVFDLYSGSGASLKIWKDAGASSLGVELGGEAVECSRLNLGESAVLRGRVSDRIPQLEQWRKEALESGAREVLVFANPPRTGLENEALEWVAKTVRPARLAYLSCSAGTLARDLAGLEMTGYRVRRILPYDFFPQTHHVETLALLDDSNRIFHPSDGSRCGDRAHG